MARPSKTGTWKTGTWKTGTWMCVAGRPPRSALDDVPNQPPFFEDINLFASDRMLQQSVAMFDADADTGALDEFGSAFGSAETLELGRLANAHPPSLMTVDAQGHRLDRVEFHPAWHELMARTMAAGVHNATWKQDSEGRTSHVARSARLYMAYQAEAGHICPVTMTHASAAALQAEPDVAARWLEKINGDTYDPALRPWWEKSAVTLGMGMTEHQGGTDVRANVSAATRHGDHYEIDGAKWFMSAPMSDAFLVLAQAAGGLTCFLVPRFQPDGVLNGLHFQRLKDKLGNRSNASSEVEFRKAYAERIGEEGAGVQTIIQMVQLTRLDCVTASAGLMRFALASACNHVRHRSVFQRRLVDQPLMRSVLASLAIESFAMTALAMRLSRAFDSARDDPAEAAYARIMTPAIKYYVCKLAPSFVYEAMECHGGNGYVEDLPLARAYREAPVNAIWEGSGNVVALDILRAAGRAPDEACAVIDKLAQEAGEGAGPVSQAILETIASADAQARARFVAEQLARLGALAALNKVDADQASHYRRLRLMGSQREDAAQFDRHAWAAAPAMTWGADWGAAADSKETNAIIDAILP